MTADSNRVRAWGPASLSNLGPGFDALGMCLAGLGDTVEVWQVPEPGIRITSEPSTDSVPNDPEYNTAAAAARVVLNRLAPGTGLEMRIHKGIQPGSGLGSSAASAVAGAWATSVLLGGPPNRASVIGAVLEGERVVSGAPHGDNVLPSLFGGLVLVSPGDPLRWRRLPIGGNVALAVVRPDVTILTREARAMLPNKVPLADAVRNAASLAFLVDAFRAGDMETVGQCIEEDRLVEPVRARLVPSFEAIRRAAKEAGALGCALTGSGPAMFAICIDDTSARRVAQAMHEAAGEGDVRSIVTHVDPKGARVTDVARPGVVL
jgi:homoserine kinase